MYFLLYSVDKAVQIEWNTWAFWAKHRWGGGVDASSIKTLIARHYQYSIDRIYTLYLKMRHWINTASVYILSTTAIKCCHNMHSSQCGIDRFGNPMARSPHQEIQGHLSRSSFRIKKSVSHILLFEKKDLSASFRCGSCDIFIMFLVWHEWFRIKRLHHRASRQKGLLGIIESGGCVIIFVTILLLVSWKNTVMSIQWS